MKNIALQVVCKDKKKKGRKAVECGGSAEDGRELGSNNDILIGK